MVVGLLSGVLASSASAGEANAARDLVHSWVTRLDQRAAELEAAPPMKATRIGAGAVMKKDDGTTVAAAIAAAVVPDPLKPTVQPSVQLPVQPAAQENEPPSLATPALESASPVAMTAEPSPSLAPPAAASPVRPRSAERVGRLARRLIELGYLTPEQWTDSFDDTIEAAVRAFQTAEGLMPDGKVGESTRQALDRTPMQAAALMRNAGTALRAFQPSIPNTVILVNLPSQTVSYVERGKLMFTMRAVVGRPSRQTPLLQDKVVSVTINPTWTVPPTVLTEDKLPVLRKKGSSGIKDAIVYLDGAEVTPERVNWWAVTPERIKIVQRPGDNNALGRFRFNLTNGEGIFLHGTNDSRLFDRDQRAASSGCVRLENARWMGETLLHATKMNASAIDHQLESGQTKTIALPKAVPVRFVYWTATVEAGGTVRVHPGIYDESPAPKESPASKRVEPKTAHSVLPTPPALPTPPSRTSQMLTPPSHAQLVNASM